MNGVTVLWSMAAAACLTLAVVHLVIWGSRRQSWDSLLFFASAASTSLYLFCELRMMLATTTEEYATALRWIHFPAWILILSLVGFVIVHLNAGRLWLAWIVCGLRTLATVANFLVGENLNYLEVTALQKVSFFGEWVTIGKGVPNPLMLISQLNLLLFFVFALDATITVWRRGDSRAAILIASSTTLLALVSISQVILVMWHIVDWPLSLGIFYLGIIAAMGYELSQNSLRALHLSKKLEDSLNRFRLVVEASSNGLVLVNEQGQITMVNSQTEKLSQYSRAELIGQPMEILVPHRFRDTHATHRASYMANPVSRAMAKGRELFILRRDGKEAPVEIGLSSITTDEGRFGLAVIVDVTKRRLDEEEIAQQRHQLSHYSRVSMLGELSGSLAHELNQPLTAILSNAQAAQRFLKSPAPDLNELSDILDDIIKDDKRAGEVIRRMRVLLRKGEVQRQPLCLNELVLEVLKLMRNDLIIQGINVHTHLTPDLPIVQADGVELQQVLINLIMNACDAMTVKAKNERILEIRTISAGDTHLQIEVVDNGSGIPDDKLKVIFEPFCTTKAQGLGLGLSVCQTIIKAHGGELWASNNPVNGATFHLTLTLE